MSAPLPHDLRQRIAALGTALAPPLLAGTRALFAPHLPTQRHREHVDLAYGDDERHRLDIFECPVPAPTGVPVLLYVHGGGFVAGDKGAPDEPFYANIGRWAARNGMLGVTMTYRLAPAHPYPAGLQDVALAVQWLTQHAPRYGGDPRRIVLWGQSAGAVHVAGYLATHGTTRGTAGVAGAVLMSGLYALASLPFSEREASYFGHDRARWAERSPLPGLVHAAVPMLFTVAQLDPPEFQEQALQLAAAYLSHHGHWPDLQVMSGHNHVSPVLQVGTPFDTLASTLSQFVQTACADP